MIWNYHDADVPRENIPVTITIQNIPTGKVLLNHYRIDQDHSNSYEVWKKMGSPQAVTDEQYQILEKAGQLQLLQSPQWISTKKGEASIQFTLPAQAVSFLKLTY
jgi:xylan 1,4-beta-xylosidase